MSDLLDLLWGKSTGHYCLAFKNDKGVLHSFYTSIDAVRQKIATVSEDVTCYYAPAVFSAEKRMQANVATLSAFWLDIDVGDNKSYKTIDSARKALDEFLAKTKLPTPFIVGSGGGLHVYWVLDIPIPPSVWVPMAENLKGLCLLNDLRADPSRTSDHASLLRPLGSLNHKFNPPRMVSLIQEGSVSPLSSFFLLEPRERANQVLNPTEPEFPDADLDKILSKCAVLQSVAQSGGAVEEPLWRGFLSVVFRCAGGASYIHELSKGDHRYSFEETQRKAELTKGPYTCANFAGHRPELCKNCPLNGHIKSPIVAGMATLTATPPIASNTSSVTERMSKVGVYTVTAKGILRALNNDTDAQVYLTVVPIWVHSVSEKARDFDEEASSNLCLEWVGLDGRYSRSTISQEDIYDTRALTKWLAANNLRACIRGDLKFFQEYIMEAIVQLMKLNAVERYYAHLGWCKDGFILGDRIINHQGATPASVKVPSNVGGLKAAGLKSRWVEATRVYRDTRLWQHAFALLASFGSPLLSLCNYQSAVVSLVGRSGFGKTLSAQFALSVYGDPKLMMQNATATANAIDIQMACHKNVPYLLDEITTMPGWRIAEFLYNAANGRQKEAATRDRELRQGSGWCMVPFVTSNPSILEMSTDTIQEAHRRRVIELAFDTEITQEEAKVIAEAFQDHYGSVADDYLQFVSQHREMIVDRMNRFMNRPEFSQIQSVNRFGLWTITAAAVGGAIAKELGLIEFEPAPVIRQVTQVFAQTTADIVDDAELAKEALTTFLLEHVDYIVHWSSKGAVETVNAHIKAYARYDSLTQSFYIPVKTYNKVLRDANVALKNILHWQVDSGITKVRERLLSNMPYVNCYTVPSRALDANLMVDLGDLGNKKFVEPSPLDKFMNDIEKTQGSK